MFLNLVLENFYVKTKHSIELGSAQAPYGYIVPGSPRHDAQVSALLGILRAQGIEIGEPNSELQDRRRFLYPVGSYVIKLDQPYGRLAKNLLERQDYPDAALTTHDDVRGWSMGYAFNVDVKEIRDKAVLSAPTTLIKSTDLKGKVSGSGTAAIAIAHLGSNNMIAFRYRLKNVAMKIAEQSFTAEGVTFPAGSFIVTGIMADQQAEVAPHCRVVRSHRRGAVVGSDGGDPRRRRAACGDLFTVERDAGAWRGTVTRARSIFRHSFDLIYKERVMKGNLKNDYDVIIMAAQNINRAAVLMRGRPRVRNRIRKLISSSSSACMASRRTSAAALGRSRRGSDRKVSSTAAARSSPRCNRCAIRSSSVSRDIGGRGESHTGVNAQKPLIQAEITRTDHPVFYGYATKIFPIKFGQGSQVFRVGVADQANVLASRTWVAMRRY